MENFNFHRPKSLADAVAALKGTEDGKFLAGGQSLIPALKLELASFSDLVSLSDIDELKGVTASGGGLTIGAATTHAEVAKSAAVRETIPSLARMAEHIGDPQVRNRGTLGGSVAHADPAADYPAAILALKAQIQTDRRTIGGDDFFTGLYETALEDDEIIKSVTFAKPDKSFYAKFDNPASKYAIVGVYVAKFADGVRVAVTGAASAAFRMTAMEEALTASFSADALAGIEVPTDDLNDERNASPEYRAHLIKVMARRAVEQVI